MIHTCHLPLLVRLPLLVLVSSFEMTNPALFGFSQSHRLAFLLMWTSLGLANSSAIERSQRDAFAQRLRLEMLLKNQVRAPPNGTTPHPTAPHRAPLHRTAPSQPS